MKNITTVLFLLGVISPSVWGNDTNIIGPTSFVEFYKKNEYSLGLNVTSNETIWPQCQNTTSYRRNNDLMLNRVPSSFCDYGALQENKNIFVGIQISKKDSKNRFTVSLQGGFNFGIHNEKRDDGSQKIRVHANLEGDYKFRLLWILPMKGKYKISGKLVTPGSFPDDSRVYGQDMNRNKIVVDGLIFNKDPYLTFRLSF